MDYERCGGIVYTGETRARDGRLFIGERGRSRLEGMNVLWVLDRSYRNRFGQFEPCLFTRSRSLDGSRVKGVCHSNMLMW